MPPAVLPAAEPTNLRDRIARVRDALSVGLVARDVPLRLALLSLFAGENLLLLGPPGTAKSELARRIRLVLRDGGSYFERLLTRFSQPEELFGPLSIAELEKDRFWRKTEGYLPAATVAFLDETFKANSAILNALLTLMNERAFDNGAKRHQVPLLTIVGASNELPIDRETGKIAEELDALYDRFLLRHCVEYVQESEFDALLDATAEQPTIRPDDTFTLDELVRLRTEAQQVTLSPQVRKLLADLREHCAAHDLQVSDRRWRKIVSLLKVATYTNGRSEVTVWDASMLQHLCWRLPDQRAVVTEWYEARVGADDVDDLGKLRRVVDVWQRRLANDRAHAAQTVSTAGAAGETLYLPPAPFRRDPQYRGRSFTRDGLLANFRYKYYPDGEFLEVGGAPALLNDYVKNEANWFREKGKGKPAHSTSGFSRAHVEARVKDALAIQRDVENHLEGLVAERTGLADHIRADLWLPPNFASNACRKLDDRIDRARTLLEQAAQVRSGFEALPVEPDVGLEVQPAEPHRARVTA